MSDDALSREKIHGPAPKPMPGRSTKMRQDVTIRDTAVLGGIGQERKLVKGSLDSNDLSEFAQRA
jgi:hypothetical protein